MPENIELEYENAKTKLVKAQSSLESDQRNIDLAHSVFKVTDLQYRKGVESLTEWSECTAVHQHRPKQLPQFLITYLQAGLDLEKASGKLKTFYTSTHL